MAVIKNNYHGWTASYVPVPLTRGFVHYFIKSFIRSFLHPIKRGASVVPTLQMRKLSLGEVKRFAQLTSMAGREPWSPSV